MIKHKMLYYNICIYNNNNNNKIIYIIYIICAMARAQRSFAWNAFLHCEEIPYASFFQGTHNNKRKFGSI